jgi:hypothetical protein
MYPSRVSPSGKKRSDCASTTEHHQARQRAFAKLFSRVSRPLPRASGEPLGTFVESLRSLDEALCELSLALGKLSLEPLRALIDFSSSPHQCLYDLSLVLRRTLDVERYVNLSCESEVVGHDKDLLKEI